jgi:hypothetical protein
MTTLVSALNYKYILRMTLNNKRNFRGDSNHFLSNTIFRISYLVLGLVLYFFSLNSYSSDSYPKISGDLVINLGIDRLSSKDNKNIKKYNSILESQSDLKLSINHNWSVETLWQSRKTGKNYYLNRQGYNPIISLEDRQMSVDDESLFIEELKLSFKNEDLIFFVGKYNPHFGNSWDKKKRSSIFTVFFGRDYQIREKIGVGITALFEKSELSFYPFFNDNTDLSNSAINKRGRNKRSYKVSGNTGSLSSYVIKLSGKNFLYFEDLSYHFAYKKIDVDSSDLSEESGYVSNFEYLFNIGKDTSIIPSYEIVKTNNINGRRGVDSLHQVVSLYFNYSSWNLSTSYFEKNITEINNKISDKYIEYNAGYRISDNMKVEVSRIGAKENNIEYRSLYTMFSYFKEF